MICNCTGTGCLLEEEAHKAFLRLGYSEEQIRKSSEALLKFLDEYETNNRLKGHRKSCAT